MKYFIILYLIFDSIITLNAQQNRTISFQIKDFDNPLAYAEVWINSHSFYLTDKMGEITLNHNLLEKGDSIQIKAIGFKTQTIIVPNLLKEQIQTIQMIPIAYQIPEIEINGNFNGQKFFNKKKKTVLYPYVDKNSICITAKISYMKDNKLKHANDSLNIIYQHKSFNINNSSMNDSILSKYILNALQLATYLPYSYSFPKYQKLSKFEYKGIKDDNWIFMLTVRPEGLTDPFYQFESSDESSSLVSIDKNGFIPKVETRSIIHSGKSNSYNLTVNYMDKKGYMAPTSISITIFFTENSHLKTNRKNDYGDKLIIDMNLSYLK